MAADLRVDFGKRIPIQMRESLPNSVPSIVAILQVPKCESVRHGGISVACCSDAIASQTSSGRGSSGPLRQACFGRGQEEAGLRTRAACFHDGLGAIVARREPMRRRLTENIAFNGIELGDPAQSLCCNRRSRCLDHLINLRRECECDAPDRRSRECRQD